MTTLETMYAPQANSPATTTVGALSTGTVQFDVLDADILPAAPMLLVLGGDTQNAETVLMTAKSGNTLTVTRAVQGTARSWAAGTQVARLFTAKDHEALIANIQALNTDKLESVTAAEVVTGAPGSQAQVEIVESGTDVTIKFTIPQGQPGQDGADGAQGEQGPAGPNEVSGTTTTSFNGILKGNGSTVAQAVAGEDYATPASDTTATLSTTWTGSAAPYTQAVAISGMTADAKIEVGLASTATAEQYAAAAAAQLMCTAQAAGGITMTAYGEKPTVAIPILVRVVG